MSQHTVICQNWEESESGWGTRPDGYTLHLTMQDHEAFVRAFYAGRENETSVPDTYTRTDGQPFPVTVGPEAWQAIQLKDKEHGVWFFQPRFLQPGAVLP